MSHFGSGVTQNTNMRPPFISLRLHSHNARPTTEGRGDRSQLDDSCLGVGERCGALEPRGGGCGGRGRGVVQPQEENGGGERHGEHLVRPEVAEAEALVGGRGRGERSGHHGAAAAGAAAHAAKAGKGVSQGWGQGWEDGSRRSSGEEPEERTGGEPEEQSAAVVEEDAIEEGGGELGRRIQRLPLLAVVDEDVRKSRLGRILSGSRFGLAVGASKF